MYLILKLTRSPSLEIVTQIPISRQIEAVKIFLNNLTLKFDSRKLYYDLRMISLNSKQVLN